MKRFIIHSHFIHYDNDDVDDVWNEQNEEENWYKNISTKSSWYGARMKWGSNEWMIEEDTHTLLGVEKILNFHCNGSENIFIHMFGVKTNKNIMWRNLSNMPIIHIYS